MKFTLVYDGRLPASANNSKKLEQKWAIRKALHPQLLELFHVHPVLMRMTAEDALNTNPADRNFDVFSVGSANFIPLVHGGLKLICGVDILFLRREAPGALILQGGDIDNRVKTLFDALRMPSENEVCEDPDTPDPFYCLLQSDTLITHYSIKTDRLLGDPNLIKVDSVKLVMNVSLSVTEVTWGNISLFGD